MHIVSTILRRYLLQRNPIAIEGLGTLHVALSGAQLLPGQRLEPPRRMLELVPTEDEDIPLTELVAAEFAADQITAGKLCREWREQTFTQARMAGMQENTMLLERVGTIHLLMDAESEFFPDPDFLTLLNPLPAETLAIPMPPTTRHRSVYPSPVMATSPVAGTRSVSAQRHTRRGQPPRITSKGKNPHNYTVSFVAVLITLLALGYLCYYLWAHTDLLTEFLPRYR